MSKGRITLLICLSLGLSSAFSCAPAAQDDAAPEQAPAGGAKEDSLPTIVPIGKEEALDLSDPERAGLSVLDVDALLRPDKVRNGAPINFNDVSGNAVVEIAINNANDKCSAQVMNSHFLLTAAHCVSDGLGFVSVFFTNRAGQRMPVYGGAMWVLRYPGADADRDTAVMHLFTGMQVCVGTTSFCAQTKPDVPQIAYFQWFSPAFAPATAPVYNVTGYGGTVTDGTNGGVLRRGAMGVSSRFFTDATNEGFQIFLPWSGPSAARPCKGDSGSPLVNRQLLSGYLFYTGIASQVPGGCTPDSGTAVYSGLTQAQAGWVVATIQAFSSPTRTFTCGAGTSGSTGVSIFICP